MAVQATGDDMKKALVVGIDHYPHVGHLHGCVADATAVSKVLRWHMDGTKNFEVKTMAAADAASQVNRKRLRENVESLFGGDEEIVLFYFAGHGYIDNAGGYLLASDSLDGHDGLSLDEVLDFANASNARNKVLLFDSCFSGAAGAPVSVGKKALLSEGITIMTASGRDQTAEEENGAGIFTSLLIDAFEGGAASLLGDITPGSIYAHIDISLGFWSQRPVFKTNVKQFVSLRRVEPAIGILDLKNIVELFKAPRDLFPLDPSYEPHPALPDPDCPPIPEHVRKFELLQKMNRLNLVVPVGADHMYYAAMNSKACCLTVLGRHYWNLIKNDRI